LEELSHPVATGILANKRTAKQACKPTVKFGGDPDSGDEGSNGEQPDDDDSSDPDSSDPDWQPKKQRREVQSPKKESESTVAAGTRIPCPNIDQLATKFDGEGPLGPGNTNAAKALAGGWAALTILHLLCREDEGADRGAGLTEGLQLTKR
jgi:hypothetical protein